MDISRSGGGGEKREREKKNEREKKDRKGRRETVSKSSPLEKDDFEILI